MQGNPAARWRTVARFNPRLPDGPRTLPASTCCARAVDFNPTTPRRKGWLGVGINQSYHIGIRTDCFRLLRCVSDETPHGLACEMGLSVAVGCCADSSSRSDIGGRNAHCLRYISKEHRYPRANSLIARPSQSHSILDYLTKVSHDHQNGQETRQASRSRENGGPKQQDQPPRREIPTLHASSVARTRTRDTIRLSQPVRDHDGSILGFLARWDAIPCPQNIRRKNG